MSDTKAERLARTKLSQEVERMVSRLMEAETPYAPVLKPNGWETAPDDTLHPDAWRMIETLSAQLAEATEKGRQQGLRVKPLEWEDHPPDDGPVLSKAVTPLGTYFICDDTDDFSGLFLQLVGHDKAQWWQHVRSTCETLAEGVHSEDTAPLKAKAQTHYERRILALTEAPARDPVGEALVWRYDEMESVHNTTYVAEGANGSSFHLIINEKKDFGRDTAVVLLWRKERAGGEVITALDGEGCVEAAKADAEKENARIRRALAGEGG